MPEAVEQLVTCSRCGYSWNWLANQITRCPKCKMPLDVKSIREHYRDTSRDLVIRPEDVKAFNADEKKEVELLIKHNQRRS